jgi:hypothetical protein
MTLPPAVPLMTPLPEMVAAYPKQPVAAESGARETNVTLNMTKQAVANLVNRMPASRK